MRQRRLLLGTGLLLGVGLLGLAWTWFGSLGRTTGQGLADDARLVRAVRGRPITQDTCDQIRYSMRRKEVEVFMGRPPDARSEVYALRAGPDGQKVCEHLEVATWRDGGAEIEVWFLPWPGEESTVRMASFHKAKDKGP
jgi:hypothetical protein